MFAFNFRLSWPYKFGGDQKDYALGEIPITKNKTLEWQLSSWDNAWTLIGISARWTMYQSHAGLLFELELFNLSLMINFCDNRHWDYEKGQWEIHDE